MPRLHSVRARQPGPVLPLRDLPRPRRLQDAPANQPRHALRRDRVLARPQRRRRRAGATGRAGHPARLATTQPAGRWRYVIDGPARPLRSPALRAFLSASPAAGRMRPAAKPMERGIRIMSESTYAADTVSAPTPVLS